MKRQENVLYHVVLIDVNVNAPEDLKEMVFKKYQTLSEDCGGTEAGILYFALKENTDQRKGIDWVELAVFKDEASLQDFRKHQKHREITDLLSMIANWYVGDYFDSMISP